MLNLQEKKNARYGQISSGGRRFGVMAGLLVVLALVVAACGSTAAPAAQPAPTDAPTQEAVTAPTELPEPTAAAAPTDAPEPAAMVTPSVTVADQALAGSQVTVAEVVSNGPGWIVIHAQADGGPGPVLGYSPVAEGTNADVLVNIDASGATETLYAMLHTDAGEIGTWEFPGGPDTPVQVEGQVVTPAFALTGGLEVEAVTPSVTVADQAIAGDQVTVAEVVSNGPGWIAIHAQADGRPGPIVGYGPVADGANQNVAVPIDLAAATTTLYAMLHTDAGTVGTWEFPGGPDAPVQVGGQVVTPSFALQLAAGEAEVEMEDFQFQPKVLTVQAGTTVKWSNKDDVQHTATSDTNVWDSGYLAKGEEFSFTFTEPGMYPYYCIPHGNVGGVGMAGTIIVLP